MRFRILTKGNLFKFARIIVLEDAIDLVIVMISCSCVQDLNFGQQRNKTYEGEFVVEIIGFIIAIVTKSASHISLL